MSLEMEFYLKILGVFIASGVIFKIMMIQQKRKEDEAEKKFQETIRMIELRNKIHKEKDEK